MTDRGMAIKNDMANTPPPLGRYQQALEVYGMALAVVMMLLGLRQWAVILGLINGPTGSFEAMSAPWQIATMHLAVVDLVAAVGLWMRVAWGKVVWIYAALSEIALHTLFAGTFGADFLIVAFHLVAFAIFVTLMVLARREPQR